MHLQKPKSPNRLQRLSHIKLHCTLPNQSCYHLLHKSETATRPLLPRSLDHAPIPTAAFSHSHHHPQSSPMPSQERGDPAAARRVAVELELELPLGGAPPYPGAAPFDLEAAVCSHGLFMMAPNRWDPASRALVRPLRLASDRAASVAVRVSRHPARPSDALLVSVLGAPGDALSPPDQTSILVSVWCGFCIRFSCSRPC